LTETVNMRAAACIYRYQEWKWGIKNLKRLCQRLYSTIQFRVSLIDH